MRSTQIKPDVY